MPDSAPKAYKLWAERCCNADPDKRPDAYPLCCNIFELIEEVNKDNSDDNTWNTIYHNNVKPLSRLEKESKYSSKLLPTGNLPKPRNSHDSHQPPIPDFSLSSSRVGLEEVGKE